MFTTPEVSSCLLQACTILKLTKPLLSISPTPSNPFHICTCFLKLMCIKLDIQVHSQSVFPFLHFRPTYLALFFVRQQNKNHIQIGIHRIQVSKRFSSYLVILMQDQYPVLPHSCYHTVHHSHAGQQQQLSTERGPKKTRHHRLTFF